MVHCTGMLLVGALAISVRTASPVLFLYLEKSNFLAFFLFGPSGLPPVVLIPSWEQPVVGNLSDKLGAFWELVIGSDASAS